MFREIQPGQLTQMRLFQDFPERERGIWPRQMVLFRELPRARDTKAEAHRGKDSGQVGVRQRGSRN